MPERDLIEMRKLLWTWGVDWEATDMCEEGFSWLNLGLTERQLKKLQDLGARIQEWEDPEASKGEGKGGTTQDPSSSAGNESGNDKGKGSSSGHPSSSAGYEHKDTHQGESRTHQGKTSKGKGKTSKGKGKTGKGKTGQDGGATGKGDLWSAWNPSYFSQSSRTS